MKLQLSLKYLEASAVFDGAYRYHLRRVWDPELKRVAWVMLNPSVANDVVLDPTCRRCEGFARDWGFGGIDVVNIFALKSTDPKALYSHPDPVGPENDRWVMDTCTALECGKVVAAWGTHGKLQNRGVLLASLLRANGVDVWCLGKSKDGHPVHPLYIPANRELVRL